LINTGRIAKKNKMKREHHERKDRTAKRSDRREERQKAECCIENESTLLCSAESLIQQCGSLPIRSHVEPAVQHILQHKPKGRRRKRYVRGEKFGANLSDTGNTRNNRYTLTFHLFFLFI